MKERNRKILLIVFGVITWVVAVVGVTYAYFTTVVNGNEEASSILLQTAELSLTFDDSALLTLTDALPGDFRTKTFTVKNDGDSPIYYDIVLTDVYSEIVKDDVVYTLTSTNGGASITNETILPTTDAAIVTRAVIAGNVTQTYTMTITFKNLPQSQDYNQGADFSGKLRIISPYEVTAGNPANQNITLVERIKLDNTIYVDNVQSRYVTSVTGIDYTSVSGYNYIDNYSIKTVNMESNSDKLIGTSYTFDPISGTYTLGGTSSSQSYTVGKYTCGSLSDVCTIMYKITKISGTTAIEVEEYVGKRDTSIWNGQGLYSTSTNTEGNLPTYFFRGNVQNNYVLFADTLWRIVRITEEGTVKMIRESNLPSNSAFNAYTTYDKKYIGYVYDTNTPSTIKEAVDGYHTASLTSYSLYLDTNYTCNDRETSQTTFTYYYGAYNRGNTTPQYKCTNAIDRISGNAGLLSFDEIKYAGALYYKYAQNFYLDNGTSWWTASPYNAYATSATVLGIYPGGFSNANGLNEGRGVRPTVTLKSTVVATGGNGSLTYPYMIDVE